MIESRIKTEIIIFLNKSKFQKEFNEIKSGNFNNASLTHEIMANYYAEQYSIAMWQMTGMVGDSLDYLYWAYDGLSVEAFKNAGNPLVSDIDLANYEQNWNNVNLNCD